MDRIESIIKKTVTQGFALYCSKICVYLFALGGLFTTFSLFVADSITCNIKSEEAHVKSVQDHCLHYGFEYLSEKFENLCGLSKVDGHLKIQYYKFIQHYCLCCAGLIFLPLFLLSTCSKSIRILLESQDAKICKIKFYEIQHLFKKTFCAHLCTLFLQVVIIITITIWLDQIMNQQFMTLGWNVMTYYLYGNEDSKNPLCVIFPISTACSYPFLSDQGETKLESRLCTLTNSAFFQWFFTIMWAYIIFIIIVTLVTIVFWLTLFRTSKLRAPAIAILCDFKPELYENLEYICEQMTVPQYFVLSCMMSCHESNFNDNLIIEISIYEYSKA